MKRGCIIGCLVIMVAGFVIGIGALIYDYYLANKAAAPFKVMAEQVRTACSRCETAKQISTSPYRIGRVLVVHSAGDAIGSILTKDTLTNVVAISPEQVSTLVCVGEKVLSEVGHYTSGDAAYRVSRDVCIIDWTTGNIIYKTTLRGSTPPAAKTKSGSGTGSDPEYAELPGFISSLTEK